MSNMDNCFASPTQGLTKRPHTDHVAKLPGGPDNANAFNHTISRGTNENYILILTNDQVIVYDLAGTLRTVYMPDGLGYLATGTPNADFRAVTIKDYTLIVNTTVTTAMSLVGAGGTFKGTKQRFTDLASETPTVDDVWEIVGDGTTGADNYYVKWDGAVWREGPMPGIAYMVNNATLPWKLVANSDGTFTFSKITYNDRVCGSNVTVPEPGFINRKISCIGLYKNRLFFAADEKITFSRSGDLFNFWPQSVINPLDTDPVDVAISHSKVSIIRNGVPFQNQLILFTDYTQFVVASQGNLTASTISITPATEIPASNICKPVVSGSNIYLPIEQNGSFSLREYYVSQSGASYESVNVSLDVPTYVPPGVTDIVPSTSTDSLFIKSSLDLTALYIYKATWDPIKQAKTQSAWFLWRLSYNPGALNIRHITSVQNEIYLLIQRPDAFYLEKIDLTPDKVDPGLPFKVLLDRRVSLLGSYDALNDITVWTLPYPVADKPTAVLSYEFGPKKGRTLNLTKINDTQFFANGNWTGANVYFGIPYQAWFRFSPQSVKDNTGAPISQARLRLKQMTLFYSNTGEFEVLVTPYQREPYRYHFKGSRVGTASLILGEPKMDTGSYTFPILSDANTVIIDVVNVSYLPSTFLGAEWIGSYTERYQRLPTL
jgi:hypothetical protein